MVLLKGRDIFFSKRTDYQALFPAGARMSLLPWILKKNTFDPSPERVKIALISVSTVILNILGSPVITLQFEMIFLWESIAPPPIYFKHFTCHNIIAKPPKTTNTHSRIQILIINSSITHICTVFVLITQSLGRYELIIRFSSEKSAREGTDGRFIFYILYIIYKISKSGAAALYIPEIIHTSRIPTL